MDWIADETTPSFNPKPEATADVTCGRSIPLHAIASGFGLNETMPNRKAIVLAILRATTIQR